MQSVFTEVALDDRQARNHGSDHDVHLHKDAWVWSFVVAASQLRLDSLVFVVQGGCDYKKRATLKFLRAPRAAQYNFSY